MLLYDKIGFEEEPRRGWMELKYISAVENVWGYEGNGLEGNESFVL